MAFEQEVELSLTIPSRELSSAREQIEGALSDVPVSFDDGPAARAAGDSESAGVAGQNGRQMRKWARQRTEDINDILDILLNMNEGGMGGGGGGMAGRAQSVIAGVGGRLSALLGGVSLANIVTKVPLRSLLTRAPAFATLVKASDLAGELVTGKLGADDLLSAPMEVGDMVTFGQLDSKAVETAIGSVTLAVGTYQIGNIVAGSLGSSALASYFTGSIGIGSILSGISSSSALSTLFTASIGIGSVLTGMGAGVLAAKLGQVGINQIIEGELTVTGSGDIDNQFSDPSNRGPRTGSVAPDMGAVPSVEELNQQIAEQNRAGGENLTRAEREVSVALDVTSDVSVDQTRDNQQVVDDAVREVEKNVLPEFRRELENALR